MSRRGGLPPEELGGRLVLSTRQDWIVSGPIALRIALQQALPGCCETIGDQLLLSFGNAVGEVEVPGLGRLELRSDKMGEGAFDAMLSDISRFASALPFAAEAGPGLSHERVDRPEEDVLYHAFVYLRHITSLRAVRGESLDDAFAAVLRNPHSILRRQSRWSPLEQASSIGLSGLVALSRGDGALQRAGVSGQAADLAQRLRGHLPRQVFETSARVDHDTAENRFVRHFVQTCYHVATRVRRRSLEGRGAFHARVRSDCDRVLASVERLRGHRFFLAIGPMTHFPAGSTVLQGRAGYREIFRHHVRMRLLARIPVDGDGLRELVELKDIAKLYEVWCFLRVAESLTEKLGAPSRVGRPAVRWSHVVMSNELEIGWSCGITLTFNASFSSSRSRGRRSFSLPLRPDIVLEVPTDGSRTQHVLDAKFRLRTRAVAGDRGSTIFKSPDIHKMHAYRDALGALTACVLYPGDIAKAFSAPNGGRVGAVPLVPGQGGTHLEEWLRTLLG